jgi:site-specific recombinase XerD
MKKIFLLVLLFIVTPTGARADFFISAESSCLSGRNFDRTYFKPLVQQLGININKTHTLRKFFVSYLIDRGANPAAVSKLVGHSNIQTTLQSYTKPITESRNIAIELLSKIAS